MRGRLRSIRVLVIETNPRAPASLTALFVSTRYGVRGATAAGALDALAEYDPDFIVLEQDTGDAASDDGTLFRRLRSSSEAPLIAMSVPRIRTRPNASAPIAQKLRAALRQALASVVGDAGQLELGPLIIDFDRRLVRRDAQDIRLTPMEFGLLACLGQQPNRIVTNKMIEIELWGPSRIDRRQSLWTLVRKIRRKLEPNPAQPRYLINKAGVGYRLVTDTSPADA